MCDEEADGGTGDHRDEHEGGHIVSRLLQDPDRGNGRKEDIDEGDVAPGLLTGDEWELHAECEAEDDEDDGHHTLLPAGESALPLDQSVDNSEDHEHDGYHTGGGIGICSGCQRSDAIGHSVGIERTSDHVGEGGDDDTAEKPAEKEE